MNVCVSLDDMKACNLKAILEMSGSSMTVEEHVQYLCNAALNSEIALYADSRDKLVHIKPCSLIPSKYEMKVFENEYNLAYNCIPSADAIYEYTEAHTRDVFYLGDELPVYGEKYCKVYNPSTGTIIKVPISCVKFKE